MPALTEVRLTFSGPLMTHLGHASLSILPDGLTFSIIFFRLFPKRRAKDSFTAQDATNKVKSITWLYTFPERLDLTNIIFPANPSQGELLSLPRRTGT